MSKHLVNFGSFRLKLALPVAAALALGACSAPHGPDPYENVYVSHVHWERYPIEVGKGIMKMEVPTTSAHLSPAQEETVVRFAQQARRTEASQVVVSSPAGGAHARAVAGKVADLLASEGIPPRSIVSATYNGGRTAPVVVSFARHFASSPECGDWSQPFTRVRETAPGVYECEVAPGRWARMRSGFGYEPPRGSVRAPSPSRAAQPEPAQPPSRAARPEPSPPPVPQSKPNAVDEPSLAVRDAPATITLEPVREEPMREGPMQEQQAAPQTPEQIPEQTGARSRDQVDGGSRGGLSCEAAAGILENFGFSDVQSTSCSGEVYGFDASRDGNSYSIRVSAADGELTEVRRR